MPFDMALTLAYAGSRGINLTQVKEGNPTVPQVLPDGRLFWTGSDPRTNPYWNNVELHTAGGNSWYNSFQFGLLKRLSRGLRFQSSYTFSKLLDETQGQYGGDNAGVVVDSTHRELDRGPAAFDITHNWRFNAIYNLPGLASGGILPKLLNGWWMSGIVSLQGGYPMEATLGNTRSRHRNNPGANRPDLLLGRKNENIVSGATAGCRGVAAGQKLGTPTLYFDPCAFATQPAGFLGNEGRNILRDPGFATLDFSLVKDTALAFLGESGKLEFRAEFFNILNRTNFSTPGTAAYPGVADGEPALANAGRITSTRSTSRQIQFALRLGF